MSCAKAAKKLKVKGVNYYRYFGVHFRKEQSELFFLRRLQSFSVMTTGQTLVHGNFDLDQNLNLFILESKWTFEEIPSRHS